MAIEEDIKQQHFETEHQKALINLLYTHKYLVYRMAVVFKEYDITRQQYNVLRILRGQHPKPASINLIKERMLDTMSDASRIVQRLRIKELITRTQCSNDRRAVEICISERGLELLEKSDAKIDGFVASMMGDLNEEDACQLNELLDKIRVVPTTKA